MVLTPIAFGPNAASSGADGVTMSMRFCCAATSAVVQAKIKTAIGMRRGMSVIIVDSLVRLKPDTTVVSIVAACYSSV